jgi:multidrug resistance efflux pump
MKPRNRIFILMGVLFLVALGVYFFTASHVQGLRLVGTVDANEVIVSSRIQGQIASLAVQDGDRVKAGQLIATIAAQDLADARNAAEATARSDQFKLAESRATELQTLGDTRSQLLAAEAQVRVAKAGLAQAEAQFEHQKADTTRAVALAKAGINSQQTRDEMVTSLNADLYQAQAAAQTVDATRADLRNAEALAQQAQVQLGYANIYSPVTGVVNVRAALEGEVVSPTTPIVTIVDLSQTWVYAPLPETYEDAVELGDKLKVTMPSGESVWGTVIAKAALADFATQRDVSRRKRDIETVQLKLLIPNPGMKYVPGMIAYVTIPQSKLEHP